MNILIIVILLFLGAAWGSFLNVVAYRKSVKKSFLSGRSYCPHCKKTLHWYDMIPILSWLILRGKCRFCRKRISIQYLLAEIATAILFVLGGLFIVDFSSLIIYFSALSFFVILFIYDAICYLVPDSIVIPAIILIFGLNIILGEQSVFSYLFGALIGGAWFFAQFALSAGKWVGGGDIRLGILMGALVGFPLIFLSLGIAYISGSALALALIALRKKTLKSRLPFATILLPSALAAWLWGEAIWRWYLSLIQ